MHEPKDESVKRQTEEEYRKEQERPTDKQKAQESIEQHINRVMEKYGLSNLDLKDILENIIRNYCTE